MNVSNSDELRRLTRAELVDKIVDIERLLRTSISPLKFNKMAKELREILVVEGCMTEELRSKYDNPNIR